MPLLKIAERRLKRKERDEELGLDVIKAKMREAGEMDGGETDSDESDSEDGSEDGSDEDDEDEEDDADGDEDDGSEGADEEDDVGDDELDVLDSDGDDDSEDAPPMTLEAALTSPTYSIPLDPSTKSVTLCVLCPGKVLKNDGMVKDHLASTSHARALKRYTARLAQGTPSTSDPRDLAEDILLELESKRDTELASLTKTNSRVDGADADEAGDDAGDLSMISANGPSAKLSKKVRRRQKAAMKRAAEKMAGEPAGGAQARSAEGKTDGVEEPANKKPKLGKRARRALKAQSLVAAAAASADTLAPASAPALPATSNSTQPISGKKAKKPKSTVSSTSDQPTPSEGKVKLNRQARRLLAAKQANGATTVPSSAATAMATPSKAGGDKFARKGSGGSKSTTTAAPTTPAPASASTTTPAPESKRKRRKSNNPAASATPAPAPAAQAGTTPNAKAQTPAKSGSGTPAVAAGSADTPVPASNGKKGGKKGRKSTGGGDGTA